MTHDGDKSPIRVIFLNCLYLYLYTLIFFTTTFSFRSAFCRISGKYSFNNFPASFFAFSCITSYIGWQYQMKEFQRQLKEHNIIQSMSRKGNCLDNSVMENFFGRLKVEMYYGEKFQTVDEFVHCLKEYIHYWNNERISLTLNGMSPVQYRTHSQTM